MGWCNDFGKTIIKWVNSLGGSCVIYQMIRAWVQWIYVLCC